jgi:hypothetical protein
LLPRFSLGFQLKCSSLDRHFFFCFCKCCRRQIVLDLGG